jgi:2-polyprenyl-6-methoxyphenol hydroxylase-like FAD-dependent oxidoreductase
MIVSNEFDVVIIGGGPVGLWLACELALAKVNVVVLERRSERVTQSRALTIHGRTLEVFALRGIAERFLSQGRPSPWFFWGGLDTLVDFSALDSRFPFTLFLPQATTERLIEERALELGVDIRRGHLVEEIEQNADSVIIRGRNGETPFGFAARYAAGADGARSFVRHALGIDSAGHPARHTMTLADVVLDAPPEEPVLTLVNEAGGLVLAPRGDGVHHRIGVIDASSPYLAPSEPVSLAEVAACAARIFGRDLRPRDPVWISRFTDKSRLAERYRKGRIFLAGDAAHINPPMGGQGMNTGIQDAMNLGWKLASVIHGTASDEILDSYQSERRPIGEALQDDTLTQFALFSAFDPPALALRRTLSGFLRVPQINRQLSHQLSGFGVAYPEPLFQAEHNWEHRKGVSGHRLSDGDLVLSDGSRTTLYPYLQEGRWVLLQVAAQSNATPVRDGINIVSLATGANDGLLGKFASMLVRPDGYVAHVRAVDGAGGIEFAA